MKLEFYPDFDLKVVEVDNNLESKVCNDGVLVAFTGEENGVFFPYESDTNSLTQPIIGVFEDEMMPLVRYIVEKYNGAVYYEKITLSYIGYNRCSLSRGLYFEQRADR